MQIYSLGHTQCLIEIPTPASTLRILVDGWLSDYAVSDLMERSPRISIDWANLPKIDIVYISHSHMDHLDPYFLSELYNHQSPLLLLAETLAYIVPTLQKYLPNTKIELLKQLKPYETNGAKITGLIFENPEVGNEEDVMSLFVEHGNSCIYLEIDTLPPEDPAEQDKLWALFNKKPYKNRLYVSSRNELEGNLSILDIAPAKRKNYEKQYRATRKEWIEWQYEKFDVEAVEYRDIRDLPGFCLALIGQGMQCPESVSSELACTKIFPLDEIAEIERASARRLQKKFEVTALTAGKWLVLAEGGITKSTTSPVGMTFKKQSIRNLEHTTEMHRAEKPLGVSSLPTSDQESLILQALNTRFLPTKLADPYDNLKNIVLQNPGHCYQIEIHYGNAAPFESRVYRWDFSTTGFTLVSTLDSKIDESYFANDLVDFLNGKQELYSNFLHKLDPKKTYRFWTVLGNNFLNHDLVIRKIEYHFTRIAQGLTAESFTTEYYRSNVSL